MSRAARLALIALLGYGLLGTAAAQSYRERPLRFVIPFPPGGGADNLARILAAPAGERLRQQVVVDNRAGAGGNIAAEIVSRSAPDGHTLLQGNVSHAISASLHRRLGYDLMRDFVPVTQLASIPFLLAVNRELGVNSVTELLARAKSKPGDLTYASSGSGGPSHLAMELMKSMTGVDIRHIPYKGAAPAAADLAAGHVHMTFFTVSAALPHLAAGRVRALALASAQRSPLAADTPTFAEAGLPGFTAETWFGVMAPRGTPKATVERLQGAFTAALRVPEVRERLTGQGFELVGNTPAEFAAFVKSEVPKWAAVVKASGASVD
jgi:tripartite-type tricarboxylate transporter receptor subunit TctC